MALVDSEAFNEKCAVTSWADWTDCSVTCEAGIRSRTRNFINPTEAAGSGCNVDLVAQEQCTGAGGNDCSVTPDPLCRTTFWSEWSPCSASCCDGMRVRTRLFFYPENEHRCTATSLMETEPCSVETCRRFFVRHSVEICQEEKEPGQCGGTFPRYWYNAATKTCERFVYTGCKGNRNQFESEEQCKTACMEGFEHEDDEEVGTEAVEFSISPAALTNTHLVPTNTHLTPTNPQPSPTNLHPTPTNPRVSTPSYARMNTTTVEISNSVAPPEVELHATVYRNMGTKDRPHLTMMTTKNAEMNDNRLREDVQTRPMADGSAHLPSKKVLKSMATLLGVPNLDHLIDFSSGKICVPANHLANVLGLDDGSINDGGAPVGCMVTEWSPWSNCSKSCGTGKRQRTRSIKVLPRNGGELCPEKMVQKRRCQQRPCPVKSCRVTQWTSWSPCTTSCGAGMQLRQRRVIQPRGEYRFLSDGDMCDWKT
uniref:BPTI/Kunitz inhibitor domain-containing protein n=1 Tax=Plectus sambesii TaxID=2011161 RepID=A0A914UXL1_9BILA